MVTITLALDGIILQVEEGLVACVEMGHLAAKLHLGDTLSMNIYREIVNVRGMRKANTAKTN